MKKFLMIAAVLFCMFSLAAEMTWSDYEKLCWKNGVEPTYEDYENLPPDTEYGNENGSEAVALFEGKW